MREDNIRNWLKEHYIKYGIKYVLLIGDPHPLIVDPNDPNVSGPLAGGDFSIPMKICYRKGEKGSLSATDYYFAELTGNWDKDGDGVFGEFYDDYCWAADDEKGIDYFPEVYVGRIPVYSKEYYGDLNYLLAKVIAFENIDPIDPNEIEYRKSFLMALAHAFWNKAEDEPFEHLELDYGAVWGPDFIKTFKAAGFDNITTMYQQKENSECDSAADSDFRLTDGALIDHWQDYPYGMVLYLAHGLPYHSRLECLEGNLIDTGDVKDLNDSKPAFVVQGGCFNGYPYKPNRLKPNPNLQYELLKNGSICNLAWTTGGYTDMVDMIINYHERMVIYNMPVGEAIYLGKATNITENVEHIENLYHITLYGDPSLSLLPVKTPVNLQATQTGLEEVTLTWVDNCTSEGHFNIYRKDVEGPWIFLAKKDQNSTTHTDTNQLDCDKEYFYRVSAFDSNNEKIGTSNVVSFFTGSSADFRPLYIRKCLDPNNKAEVKFFDKSYSQFGEIKAYEWDFGDQSTSSEKNPTHIYEGANHFTVTLTVTSKDSTSSTCNNQKVVKGCVYIENSDNFIGSYEDPNGKGEGLWIRDMKNDRQYTIKAVWEKLHKHHPVQIATGNIDGDGLDELVGWWRSGSTEEGIWVRYHGEESEGPRWEKIYPETDNLIWITVGDINGDSKDDLVGSWRNIGVWVRYSGDSPSWERLHASSADIITAGDLDGDGKDDLIGKWDRGIWVRYATKWERIKDPDEAAGVVFISSGNMNGDSLDDILVSYETAGTWVRYSDPNDIWEKLDTRVASLLATGNFDDDGKDDLYVVWEDPNYKGVWVWSSYWEKFTESRQRLDTKTPNWITTGKIYPNPTFMNLKEGWNMISLPCKPINSTASGLFPEAKVIYGYKKGLGYVRIKENEEVQTGKGYWILFEGISNNEEAELKVERVKELG